MLKVISRNIPAYFLRFLQCRRDAWTYRVKKTVIDDGATRMKDFFLQTILKE